MGEQKNTLRKRSGWQVNTPLELWRDKRMSVRTKGIYALLKSHDENWQFYVSQIADDCQLSKETLRKELKTLEEYGYLKRTVNRNEKGQVCGYIWELFDYPNQRTSETEQTTQTELLPETDEGKEKKQPKPRAVKKKYGRYENVPFTDEQLEKLKEEFPRTWEERIEKVSVWADSKGKTVKDGLATIRNWARKNNDYEQPKRQATDRDDWL